MASSSSSTVVCASCESPLEVGERYSCTCKEASHSSQTGTLDNYCDVCILGHIKAEHDVKDFKGGEVGICAEHRILPFCYCHTEKRLICIRCQCPQLGHDYVNITEEAKKCRKEIFILCDRLGDREKEVKWRKENCQDLMSQLQKQQNEFDDFVHNTMVTIETTIKKSAKKGQSGVGGQIKQTREDTECCISGAIEFQGKMRGLLASSDGTLVKQFFEYKDQVVKIVKEQERLTGLVYNFKSSMELFNADTFIQQTANDFLAQVKLPQLQQTVSQDVTETPDCEIEDLDELQKVFKDSRLVAIDHNKYVLKSSINGMMNEFRSVKKAIPTSRVPFSSGNSTAAVINPKYRIIERTTEPCLNLFKRGDKTYSANHIFKFGVYRVCTYKNGEYRVYCTSDNRTINPIRSDLIGYNHPLLPVKLDNPTFEVYWVYWDAVEKAIRVSGKDTIKIACEEKPLHAILHWNRPRNKYCKFAIVINKWDVLVVDPEVGNYLTIIPQVQQTLRRIDCCYFSKGDHLFLFDFSSNRGIEVDGKQTVSLCHWTGTNSVIVHPTLGRRLCASFNIGTPELPKIQHMVLPVENE